MRLDQANEIHPPTFAGGPGSNGQRHGVRSERPPVPGIKPP